MVRAPFVDKNGIRRGAWSKEEDDKLRGYVQKYGHWNWREIPKFAGLSRCGKSCRLRWMNYLRPDVKHGNYSMEEEDLILQLHEQHGNKWSTIAAQLPERTDNEVKNYWHTHLKKRAKQKQKQSSSDIDDQSEEKHSSREASESEIANVYPFNSMLERSPLSLEISSSTDRFPYLNFDPDPVFDESSCSNWTYTTGVGNCFDIAQDYSDFWTEPFVADNHIYNQDIHQTHLLQREFMPPLYDDSTDFLIDQVMQEFQEFQKKL